MDQRDAILLVANYDSDVGYAWWLMESFWVAIANQYASRYRVLLAYPSISRVPPAIESAPIEAIELDMNCKDRESVAFQVDFLRRHQVKLVYLTDQPATRMRYACWRSAGVRAIVSHDHTPGNRSTPGRLKATLKSLRTRLPYVNVDALVGATSFVSERHREVTRFPARRCYTAENGLPARPLAEPVNVHERFNIAPDRRILVAVGRAHRVKGIELVLDAMALLIGKGRRDLHLLHCGDGPDLTLFQSYATTKNINGWVTFAGRQSEIPGILRGCDLAIHASSAEVGYSLAVLEYMEAGLPVVISDDPSVCAATESDSTGLYFRAGDARSAADAIAMILDDCALASRLGAEARIAIEQRFTLSETHAALLNAIDAVMPCT